MPYDAATESKVFDDGDWSAIAEYAVGEKRRRKSDRRDLEKQWEEIDRQLAMKAKPRSILSGQEKDWYWHCLP